MSVTHECVDQRKGSESNSRHETLNFNKCLCMTIAERCGKCCVINSASFTEVDDSETVSTVSSRATLAVAPIPAERTATYPMVPWHLTWHMGTLASHGVKRFDI